MSTAPMPNRWLLVIDDNPAICEDFRKVLQRNARTSSLLAARAALFEDTPLDAALEGFEVDCANQGQKGLNIVLSALQRGCPYAMAFVDRLMPPGWEGLETIDHLWSVDPELEMVICTAFTDLVRDRFPQRLEHSDKLLILRKPFDNIEVWQTGQRLDPEVVSGSASQASTAHFDGHARAAHARTPGRERTSSGCNDAAPR